MLRVFNPNPGPVVIDGGRIVPGLERRDIADGPKARRAIDDGRLLDKSSETREAIALKDLRAWATTAAEHGEFDTPEAALDALKACFTPPAKTRRQRGETRS